MGDKHGRLGDICKLVNMALNTRLCSVLRLVLPIKHRPIAHKIAQLPIGLLSAAAKDGCDWNGYYRAHGRA